MAATAAGTRGATAAASSALAVGRVTRMTPTDRSAWTARFEKIRENALCPNCLEADNGTVCKGSLSLAPAQSQPHRQNSSPLRLHCSTCKRHLQSDKTVRCIVVTAELTTPSEQVSDTLCTPDQFTSLSEQVALLTTEIQQLKSENERLRANTKETEPESSPLANMVRDLIAQQSTVAMEARTTANESAAAVAKLTKTVNDSMASVATLAETVNGLISSRALQTAGPPACEGNQTAANAHPMGNKSDSSPEKPPEPLSRPSFVEIAKRNLPGGVTLNENYEGIMLRNARTFCDRFVKPVPPPRPERLEIPSTALKPIYGSGLLHQAISEILRGVRSLLPAQATRGISLFGTSSFELLVEESVEEHAREILTNMGMRLISQKDPLTFCYPSGTPVTDEKQKDRCAAGARKRWERAQSGCPLHTVKTWYQEQLSRLAEKFPNLENQVSNNQ